MKQRVRKFFTWSLGATNAGMLSAIFLFKPNDDGGCLGCGACGGICGVYGTLVLIFLALLIFPYICLWKIFEKAGKPGWAGIVPIYNLIVLTEIVGRPTIWVVLALIPGVNIVIGVILSIDLAKSFGKDPLYGVGLCVPILNIVLMGMLAFGKDTYQGPSVQPGQSGF